MEGEQARRELNERLGPDWLIMRRKHGGWGAWYTPAPRGGNGLHVFDDPALAGLEKRAHEYERVLRETHSAARALAAAEALET